MKIQKLQFAFTSLHNLQKKTLNDNNKKKNKKTSNSDNKSKQKKQKKTNVDI